MLLRAVERIIISFSASAAKSVRGARIINSGAAGPELQPAPVTVNRTKTGHKTVHSLTSNFVWPSVESNTCLPLLRQVESTIVCFGDKSVAVVIYPR